MKRVLFAALLSLACGNAAWAAPANLQLKRTGSTYANGDPIWQLQLIEAGRVIQSWKAVASASASKLRPALVAGLAHRFRKATTGWGSPNRGARSLDATRSPLSHQPLSPVSTTATQGWTHLHSRPPEDLANAVRRYNVDRSRL